MNYLTLKVGVMELNYGDEHFRRSDNAEVMNNAFVGNYIMDAFTTAPGIGGYVPQKLDYFLWEADYPRSI